MNISRGTADRTARPQGLRPSQNELGKQITVDYVLQLLQQAQARPNAIWLNQPVNGEWRTWTWAQALDQVQRMASALRAQDYPPGSRIAISGRNTAHWIMADLAISMAGHIGVGLYPRQSGKITRYIFDHADIRAVFVGPALDLDEMLAVVPEGVSRWSLPYPGVPPLDDQWDAMVARHEPHTGYTPPLADEVVMLVYTSGTSGFPKGVMLTAGNVDFAMQRFVKHVLRPHGLMQSEGSDRLFSYLPLAHFFERLVVEGESLVMGAQVFFMESIETMGENLAQVAPTMFCGVPLVYSRIQRKVLDKMPQRKLDMLLRIPFLNDYVRRSIAKKIGLQNAKFILTGSAPIAISLLEWYHKLGIRILQGGGPTETFAYVSATLMGSNRFGSVGKPFPDTNFRLGEDNEIQVRHGGVMAGYFKDEEATRDAFTEDGYFRTGDKGRLDADGYIYIVGRIKEIFKTMTGKYVAPAPIEEAIRTADIESCCLVGPGVPQPILLVSLSPEARQRPRQEVQQDLMAAMERVNPTLEPHAKVGKIVVVAQPWTIDGGMLTPTMKVKRAPVQEYYADLIARESANREPFVWEDRH